MSQRFDRVVSLGQSCRAKFHLERHWGAVRQNGSDPVLVKTVFDWQVTPNEALLVYMANDFRGMMERADLGYRDGRVVNNRYGTLHLHDFPPNPVLADHFDASRSRHDHLCARTRDAFASPLTTLFVRYETMTPHSERRVRRAIARLRAGRPFTLAVISDDGQTPTDPAQDWQGNWAHWDAELARFEIATEGPVPHTFHSSIRIAIGRAAIRLRPGGF